jgi:hypothetical protein
MRFQKCLPGFLLAFAGLFSLAHADLAGGGWYDPLGSSALGSLSFAQLGASKWEAALQNRGAGSLTLKSGGGAAYDQDGKTWASHTQSDMDLEFLLVAPMNTLVGLTLESPWPEREAAVAGDTLWRETDPTRFGVLLGMRPVNALLVYGEIPIADETGVWRAGLELFPFDWARLRLLYNQQKTEDHILSWNLGTSQEFSRTERQGEAELALKLPLHLEAAAGVRYSDFEGTPDGTVWGAGGEVVYLKSKWSLKVRFNADWRDLQNGAASWSYDSYLAGSRLQRTFWNFLRVGLEAQEQALLQNSNAAWLEQKKYGGDLRLWWQGLYVQCGGFFVRSAGEGVTNPDLGFGREIKMEDLFSRRSLEAKVEAGIELEGTLYRYTYEKWFAFGSRSPVLRPNTIHRFEIAGAF